MSKSTVAPKSVTAAAVREFFRADEKRMAALSPEARKTVAEGARGSLHTEAVEVHNKRRRSAQYVPGNSKAAVSKAKADASALREQARQAGFTVGKRGRLPKAFLDSLKG